MSYSDEAEVEGSRDPRSADRALLEEIDTLRIALRETEAELQRVRAEAENKRHLVDIMHDVMGNLSTEEVFHMVARRLAKALYLSHSAVILAKQGGVRGVVATAFERPSDENVEIELDQFPEVVHALDQGRPVLIQDLRTSPLYARLYDQWLRTGVPITVRSVIAIPFTFESTRTGVFLLRRSVDRESLSLSDVDFSSTVIRSAVNAIEQSHAIEKAKADNARLEALAHTDPLTHLLNRRALRVRLMAELDRVRRYNSPLALLMIDLDHFKIVNDTYGHLVGDHVLQEIAVILQRSLRSVDMVARYGGEEFVIVLPETGEHGAMLFAERIRQRIEQSVFKIASGRDLRLTVSIGLSTFPGSHVESAEDLFARADAALYRAKGKGRNRVCL